MAVLYGGRSGEHEVSLRSAASVIRNLDPGRFEVIPVAIDKQGVWHRVDGEAIRDAGASLPIPPGAPKVQLRTNSDPSRDGGVLLYPDTAGKTEAFDVAFPVLHGPMCEDGTLQGMFELAEVAYVGCGVLASSAGMDKEISKRLAHDVGVPIVPWVTVRDGTWKKNSDELSRRIARELGYPVFVKPANMGSSVGVHRVKDASGLRSAMEDALRYDTKILVEKAVSCREIEVSVLEHPDPTERPLVSVPGEVVPTHEFYSYEAKYLDDNGAALLIPARLSEEQTRAVQKIAGDVFTALEGEGMMRCDLFIDKESGGVYFNEVNTIPGFTSISMYPKMWEASGVNYRDLLSRLVDLGLHRHERRRKLLKEFREFRA